MKSFLVLVINFLFLRKLCDCSEIDNNNSFTVRPRTGPKPPWNETYMDKLRKDLLANYDKYARPGQHYDVTTVKIGLTVTHVETDESNSTITVSSWLKLTWSDPKLKWNKDDYGGLESIKMADHEVWQPDICLYNSALGSTETVTRYGNPYAIVYDSGAVLWIPPTRFNALCEFDLYYWPFDTQNCYLKFSSWTHTGKQLKLELFDGKSAEIRFVLSKSAWETHITSEIYDKYYDCCPNSFYTAQFNLKLVRKSSSYIPVVVIPMLVVMILILIQCCLPFNEQKIILGSCTALMIAVLLSYFIQKVTSMGNDTPWIVLFYSTCLYMVSISLAESIFVLLMLKTEQKQPLPWIIKRHLQGKLGKFLLLENHVSEYYSTIHRYTEEEMKDYHLSEHENDAVIIKSTTKDLIREEWEIFATALDRILLYIYCFIFFVLILCYII